MLQLKKLKQAGERGADVIYNGQYDVLKDTEDGELIKVKIQFQYFWF